MSASLKKMEELKIRVFKIEQELFEVLKEIDQLINGLNDNREKDWRSKFKWVDREDLNNKFGKWFKQTGITNAPIGIEKLQKMGLKEGIKPEDNFLSRGIIEMREE